MTCTFLYKEVFGRVGDQPKSSFPAVCMEVNVPCHLSTLLEKDVSVGGLTNLLYDPLHASSPLPTRSALSRQGPMPRSSDSFGVSEESNSQTVLTIPLTYSLNVPIVTSPRALICKPVAGLLSSWAADCSPTTTDAEQFRPGTTLSILTSKQRGL